jgi:transposase
VPISRRRKRWSLEFKLQVISRMDAAVNVTELAEELGINRELLYLWRRKYKAGGASALPPVGRPSRTIPTETEAAVAPVDLGDPAAAQRRIGELERKIGQQQLELDFFRAALRHVREQQPRKGAPGDTTSTR